MTHVIIDRRPNSQGKNTVNRYLFVQRVKKHVRDAITQSIESNDIKGVTQSQKRTVSVPAHDLKQPSPSLTIGGVSTRVYTGNTEFVVGDRLERPPSGDGTGSSGSKDGEGEDNFEFELDDSDYFDILFEDCGLPNLEETVISKSSELSRDRAGFSKVGAPARLNVYQTMRNAKTRRSALRTPKKKKLSELEKQRAALVAFAEENKDDTKTFEIEEIDDQIVILKKRMKRVPFIDDGDVRFNHWELNPKPSTQAVMFCIMDVSISMQEHEKDIAKRFFVLLNFFLEKNYDDVDLVFISHTHIAKEVDEDEFFHSKESGGTLVSTGLEKMIEIQKERYNKNEWNIFVSQASDGDNWSYDNVNTEELLVSQILPVIRYYAYIEVSDGNRWGTSDLWDLYTTISQGTHNMAVARISDKKEIYPVFKKLFSKKNPKQAEQKGQLMRDARARV